MSAVARFVIDDEPLVGAEGEPFERGGVLTFVDARVGGAGRRTSWMVVLAALAAVAVSVLGLRSTHDAQSSDGSRRSVVLHVRHRADVPALVIGVAAPGRRGTSSMSGELRFAGRR